MKVFVTRGNGLRLTRKKKKLAYINDFTHLLASHTNPCRYTVVHVSVSIPVFF